MFKSYYLDMLKEADNVDLNKSTKENYIQLVRFVANEMSEHYWNIFL